MNADGTRDPRATAPGTYRLLICVFQSPESNAQALFAIERINILKSETFPAAVITSACYI